MDSALVLRDLRKAFGSTKAVDGISLTIPRGKLYGVIGPNGAGKTTCIRMIMSILFPDSGELSVRCMVNPQPARRAIESSPARCSSSRPR